MQRIGADENRINEIIAHAGLSQQSQLPALADDAGVAATAVIKSSKQVGYQPLEDGLEFAGNFLSGRTSRKFRQKSFSELHQKLFQVLKLQ